MSQINESWLWHRIMGHINFDSLVKISSTNVVRDFPKIKNPINTIYKVFQVGMKIKKFKLKEYSTTGSLELVHTHFYGPTRIRNTCGDMYFMLLIDAYSRMAWVTFLKEK